jgi:hypothetical protein
VPDDLSLDNEGARLAPSYSPNQCK